MPRVARSFLVLCSVLLGVQCTTPSGPRVESVEIPVLEPGIVYTFPVEAQSEQPLVTPCRYHLVWPKSVGGVKIRERGTWSPWRIGVVDERVADDALSPAAAVDRCAAWIEQIRKDVGDFGGQLRLMYIARPHEPAFRGGPIYSLAWIETFCGFDMPEFRIFFTVFNSGEVLIDGRLAHVEAVGDPKQVISRDEAMKSLFNQGWNGSFIVNRLGSTMIRESIRVKIVTRDYRKNDDEKSLSGELNQFWVPSHGFTKFIVTVDAWTGEPFLDLSSLGH